MIKKKKSKVSYDIEYKMEKLGKAIILKEDFHKFIMSYGGTKVEYIWK